ncbi:MAG TPA: hypothetical protein VKV39_09580 [Candidatus Sulfotelmatobacter sp.]|nr:hypothetical protein [Candidatus Sulfotelmatobacter sp.]
MKAFGKTVSCTVVVAIVMGASILSAQESAAEPRVLHIQQSQTTSQGSQNGFPTFLSMYHVLDGATSSVNVTGLRGSLKLKNYDPTFSEVLWLLVYWQGECPARDIALSQVAGTLWSDIVKNPTQSDSSFPVNLVFPHPLPSTGCIGLYYGGGPLLNGKSTMSADLELIYTPSTSNPNSIVNLGGAEYCFGQDWGCQNATAIDGEAFAVPTALPAGHLLEIYGNISDSTFDGTNNYGPLPTGASWGSVNDFYLLPGGCGIFAENINSQGFPNPAPLSTLHSWLPKDALHLASAPQVDRISTGATAKAALQNQVDEIFSVPVKVNKGDCMLVIFGRTGNGATDNETQVNLLMAP